MVSKGQKIAPSWGSLIESTLAVHNIPHPLPNTVFYTRNMKDVWNSRSGVDPAGSLKTKIDSWSITFCAVPDTDTVSLWFDLPQNAKEIYCAWAMEGQADGNVLEMRFIDTATNNYVSVYEDTAAANADHKVKKYIGGVLSTIGTEAVDLFNGSQHEYAFWWVSPGTIMTGGWWHSYRGDDDYRAAADLKQLTYREKLYGSADALLTKVNRIMFTAYNGSGGATGSMLQVMPSTFKPFVLQYDTLGHIEYP